MHTSFNVEVEPSIFYKSVGCPTIKLPEACEQAPIQFVSEARQHHSWRAPLTLVHPQLALSAHQYFLPSCDPIGEPVHSHRLNYTGQVVAKPVHGGFHLHTVALWLIYLGNRTDDYIWVHHFLCTL